VTPELAALVAALRAALSIGDDASAVERVCATLMESLPCRAAAVTIMVSDLERQTLFAGDEVIRTFELAQFGVGEGPSLQAFRSGRPVLIPDVSAPWVRARWVGLGEALAGLDMTSVFCLPMQLGAISVGVCALYSPAAARLDKDEVAMVLEAVEMATLVLLQLRGHNRNENLVGRWLEVDGLGRRAVHQATGMLMVQLGLSAEDAFARLRGHCFAAGRDIEQVAGDIVHQRFNLAAEGQ
jgi:ANTAR domain/GAF domain